MIAAIVLAAGGSKRLGEPKQLVRLGGETLLERAVRVAREAGCSPVVVLLGAEYVQVLTGCSLGDVITVVNDQWQEGMSSSLRLGVHAVKNVAGEVDGVVVMTCDQPAVTTGHLQRLMAGAEIKASRYDGRKGVPAYFPKDSLNALADLTGDSGARDLLRDAGFEDLSGGELDVDTVEDLQRARALFS